MEYTKTETSNDTNEYLWSIVDKTRRERRNTEIPELTTENKIKCGEKEQ